MNKCGKAPMVRKPRPSMQEIYLLFARLIATRSSCLRQSQGAVITSADLTNILSVGYNGSLRGGAHTCTEDAQPGKCGCFHAEANAILKVTVNDPNKIMFCTSSPCQNCAEMIIQSQFSAVYYINEYRDPSPVHLLQSFGITCGRIKPEDWK